MGNGPSVAELRFAAAVVATGHLSEFVYLLLKDLDLSGIECIASLGGTVTGAVHLDGLTGDISPSSPISDVWMDIYKMELDEAATRGLLVALLLCSRGCGLC